MIWNFFPLNNSVAAVILKCLKKGYRTPWYFDTGMIAHQNIIIDY